MADDIIPLPFGPRVEYAESGFVPPKVDEKDVLIDPRTGVLYGAYTEDQLAESMSKTVATATMFGTSEGIAAKHENMVMERVDKNPEQSKFHTDIWNVSKNMFSQGSQTSAIGELGFDWMDSGDDSYLKDIESAQAELERLRGEIPDDFTDHGLIHETVRRSAEVAGQLKHMAGNVVEHAVITGAATGGTGLAIAGPLGAVALGVPGAAIGAAGGVTESAYKEMTGALYIQLRAYEDQEGGAKIDPSVAKDVAKLYGGLSTVPEVIADTILAATNIAGLIGKGSLATVFSSAASEGGTELVQALIESIAIWDAKRRTAELTGEEFTPQTMGEIIASAKEQTRAGILGGGGLSSASASVGKTIKFSTKALNAIEERGAAVKAEELVALTEENDRTAREEVQEVAEEPVVSAVDPETDVEQVGTDLTEEEITIAEEVAGVEGTEITEDTIDNIVIDNDEQSTDDQIDEIITMSEEAPSDREVEFGQVLREIVNKTQAKAIESIMLARATSAGMTVPEYMDKRGVKLINRTDKLKLGLGGRQTLANIMSSETSNIITAFQGSNVSVIAHELAHMFQADLTVTDQAIMNKWVGSKRSSNWTRAQTEQFADGFEAYLKEGVAPNPELAGIFKKFARWITAIYKGSRDTVLAIELSPEAREVFGRLLDNSKTPIEKRSEIDSLSSAETAQPVLLDKTVEETEARIAAVNDGQAQFHGAVSQATNDRERLRAYVATQVKVMRDMFDRGDMQGYKRAKAKLKATLARRRGQSKMFKKHKALRKAILKTLKAVLPKRSAGKLVGKMNLEAQEFISEMYPIMLNIKTLKGAASFLETAASGDWVATSDAHLYALSLIEHATTRTPQTTEALQLALNDLKAFITTGKSNSPFVKNFMKAKAIAAEAIVDAAGNADVKEIVSDTTTAEQANQQRQKEKTWKEKIATMSLGKDFLFGWGGLLNMVSAYSSAENGKSVLSRALDFFPSRTKYNTDVRNAVSEMATLYQQIYGLNEYMMNRQQNKDYITDIDIGLNVKYNKAMLRQLWLYIQDPTLAKRLEANKITPEVIEAVESAMSEQDKDFALSLRNLFSRDSEYTRNNEVYTKVFGVNLPRIDNYVPLQSESLGDQQKRSDKPESMFVTDLHTSRTPTTASAIKARTKTDKAPLIINGDLGLFDSFTEEMSHFRAFAESVRLANSVLQNKGLKDAIIFEYGHGAYTSLIDALNATASNGTQNGLAISAVDRFRSAFVSSTVGAAFSVFSKQLISVSQYWQKMPATALVSGLMNFWKHPVRNWKEINSMDYMQNRVGNIDIDLKDITSSRAYQKFRLNPTTKNFMTLNVKLGDKAAIILGGWAYARYLQKGDPAKGIAPMSRADALNQMAAESDNTQQSSATEERSRFQRGGTFPKILATYSSGPVQAARQEIEAIRGLVAGRMSAQQAAKTLFIYHVIVPVMYSVAASVYSGEDSEELIQNAKVAAALGPLGSSYAVGRTVTSTVKYAFGMKSFMDAGPFTDTVRGIGGVAKDFVSGDVDEISLDDMSQAIEGLLVLSGRGVPLNRLTRIGQNAATGNIKGTILGSKLEE